MPKWKVKEGNHVVFIKDLQLRAGSIIEHPDLSKHPDFEAYVETAIYSDTEPAGEAQVINAAASAKTNKPAPKEGGKHSK